ncbi:MAG: DUF2953 domain-containing protein [Clostridia bacterium]|nr:DUF2953 domain-containing protein [Clostridia bacterium]
MTALYIVLAVLAVIVVLAVAIMCIRLTVDICIRKDEDEDLKEEYILTVLGCKIDLLEFSEDNKALLDEAPKGNKPEITLAEKLKKIRNNIESRIHPRHPIKKRLWKRFRKRIKVHRFDFNMTFGLDDAADTGIATGAAWGAIYNIFGLVANLCTVKDHKITITPVFDRECFSLEFCGKVRCKVFDVLMLDICKEEKLFKV